MFLHNLLKNARMETLRQSDNRGRQGPRKKRFQYPTFKTLDVEAKIKENL
jgi:hypothetical protein